MARSPNQKQKLLYLRQYLLRCSDDAHPVTLRDMIGYLAAQGIAAERKSIYDDLETLRLFGVDVETVRDGSITKYFVGERQFQLPELKLLVDSVQSSKFITRKKSLELIKKIESLGSEYDARQLHRQVYVRGRIKTMNESIYYNVDTLHAATEENSAITFRYYEWNTDRQRVFRHGGKRYLVSPWSLLWDDANYYMIAYDHDEELIKHFRVDKMTDIRLTDTPRQGENVFERFDMNAYSETHFGMFSGDVMPVRLEFQNSLAGAVIDRFGTDIPLIPTDEEHFSVTVNAAVNVQFFGWLCGFGDRVRVLSPEFAVREMRRHIESIARIYR